MFSLLTVKPSMPPIHAKTSAVEALQTHENAFEVVLSSLQGFEVDRLELAHLTIKAERTFLSSPCQLWPITKNQERR